MSVKCKNKINIEDDIIICGMRGNIRLLEKLNKNYLYYAYFKEYKYINFGFHSLDKNAFFYKSPVSMIMNLVGLRNKMLFKYPNDNHDDLYWVRIDNCISEIIKKGE
jgi:hypothetical protein